mmetsp:Transcript_3765/g.9529  ORF Transcript_3765/g.9529 Transcript_3765/m.9529 type:complete len:247 (-) Transcript_3765:707-1447(-)
MPLPTNLILRVGCRRCPCTGRPGPSAAGPRHRHLTTHCQHTTGGSTARLDQPASWCLRAAVCGMTAWRHARPPRVTCGRSPAPGRSRAPLETGSILAEANSSTSRRGLAGGGPSGSPGTPSSFSAPTGPPSGPRPCTSTMLACITLTTGRSAERPCKLGLRRSMSCSPGSCSICTDGPVTVSARTPRAGRSASSTRSQLASARSFSPKRAVCPCVTLFWMCAKTAWRIWSTTWRWASVGRGSPRHR